MMIQFGQGLLLGLVVAVGIYVKYTSVKNELNKVIESVRTLAHSEATSLESDVKTVLSWLERF